MQFYSMLVNKSLPLLQMSFGMVSKNPVLKNVTDFLVDEGSAEEDALMGMWLFRGHEGSDRCPRGYVVLQGA